MTAKKAPAPTPPVKPKRAPAAAKKPADWKQAAKPPAPGKKPAAKKSAPAPAAEARPAGGKINAAIAVAIDAAINAVRVPTALAADVYRGRLLAVQEAGLDRLPIEWIADELATVIAKTDVSTIGARARCASTLSARLVQLHHRQPAVGPP